VDFPAPSGRVIFAALSGLLAGLLHVVSGPDHLAAVAPLAVRGHRRAWLAGARWGLGHSAGVALVGLLALALREVLPVERLSSISERLVGVLLIGIGIWTVRRALRVQVHAHAHEHDGSRHEHVHFHAPDHAHPPAETAHVHTHAAFGIGTLHGFAGASHFLGVLPALAFSSHLESVLYLVAFAGGTVVAMAAFSSVLGWVAHALGAHRARAYRGLMGACAATAFGVGGWWLVNGG
jgi:sulfite exporter TauE/SafE